MDTIEEKLELAERKIGLRAVVETKAMSQCQQEGLDVLAGISLIQLQDYIKKVVLAAWLDFVNEVGAEKLSWSEEKSELNERAMLDVTKLLRLKALKSLK